MSVRQRIAKAGQTPQVTQASAYYQQLEQRFNTQASQRVPRSEAAWGAEKGRLGSWSTGVGALRTPGVGNNQPNGLTDPRFNYDPDEEQQR